MSNMSSFFRMKSCVLLVVISVLASLMLTFYFLNMKHSLSIQKNKETVVRLIEEVWNDGNLKLVDQLIAPQYTIRHDPGEQLEGKTLDLDAYKKRVEMSRQVFSDQKFHIVTLVGDDDKVAVSWIFTGTQKGNIPGLPTTNKKVTFSGLTIYYFSKGKIIGHWQVVDRLGLLQGLSSKNH